MQPRRRRSNIHDVSQQPEGNLPQQAVTGVDAGSTLVDAVITHQRSPTFDRAEHVCRTPDRYFYKLLGPHLRTDRWTA